MAFDGFDSDALELLRKLPSFSKAQYEESRALLKEGIREPGLALIEAVARAIDPALIVDRRGSISPLHTDLRFAKPNAARYKDHLLLTTWQGPDKKSAPILWLRIDSESVGFASGMAFNPKSRARWRKSVGESRGEAFATHIAVLRKRHSKHEFEVAGECVKKVPAPWGEDHARADLLRRTSFQIRFRERLPKSIGKPAFAGWCEKRLRELLPVHRWLASKLGSEKET